MASLWTGLLFLHGHIADPALARRLDAATAPPPPPRGKRQRIEAKRGHRPAEASLDGLALAAAVPAPSRGS